MNCIKIAQHNIQSINNKKPLVKSFLFDNNIDIYLMNETWLKKSDMCKLTGYNFIGKCSNNGYGGVGILLRDSLRYKILDTTFYQDIQSTAVSIETISGPLSILCVYCPPKNNRIKINNLKKIINILPKPCLVSGDFNAHHVAFGCHSSNSRGTEIFNLFDELDLCLLNTGTPTTVHRPNNHPSAIDISFISPSLAHLCEWSVGDNPLGSYHYPTFINIHINPSKYIVNNQSDKYLFNKANWLKYLDNSEKYFKDFACNIEDPLLSYTNFCDILSALRDECIPIHQNRGLSISRVPAPWWNSKCAEAVKNSHDALKQYRNSCTMENYINYKKLDALKKRIIKEEKKNSWHNLCSSFNRYTPITRVWNYVKRFKRINIPSASKNDEWLPKFIEKLTSNVTPVDDIGNLFVNNNVDDKNNFLIEPFTWCEFCTALESRKNTTPGLDGIPYIMIKKLHKNGQIALLNIFNLLWKNQIVPESWNTQCVVPILKPGKPSDDHNSYRPISLSSCIGKLFEQIIKIRLDYFTETNNLLPPIQFGFRKGKSTSESFVSFISDMKKCLLSHSGAISVFLDVQGAYDNVNIYKLVQILRDIGIPGNLLKWLFRFLNNRCLFVKYNNILHGPHNVNRGVMQGSTLSPILYNLFCSQILKYVKSDVKILQFADDLVIYSVDRIKAVALHKINTALIQLNQYYTDILNLNINVNKSSFMTFGDFEFDDLNIKYNNLQITHCQESKFLGVIIDSKLKFSSHINYICKKAHKGIDILRCLAGKFWGADPKILSLLYKSLVRSHFDYSCLAYLNVSPTLLRKLDVIQNIALRIISGAMRSTPINSMEAETGIPPLCIRRLLLAEKFCVKMLALSDSVVLDHLKLSPSVSRSQDIPNITVDVLLSEKLEMLRIMFCVRNLTSNIYSNNLWPVYNIPFYSLVSTEYTIHLTNGNNNTDFKDFLASKSNFHAIYTDGSKTDNSVTSAYYDATLNVTKCFKLDTICSIFTAECYAVYNALLYIDNVHNSVNNFLICTDSQSVLVALQNNSLSFKLNYLIYNIQYLLYMFKLKNVNIEFTWVGSHRGIAGNEKVDDVARGIHDEDHSTLLKIPFTDYYQNFKETTHTLWEQLWNHICNRKGSWYANIQKHIPRIPWYDKHKECNSRKYITVINRLRFGHCLVPTHLYRLNIISNSNCSHCDCDSADIAHYIFHCPSFSLQRLTLVADIQEIVEEVPRRIEDILANRRFFTAIYKFICNTVEKI